MKYAIAACALATVVFGGTAVFEAYLLNDISQANKAQQTAFVCFDMAGKVTTDDNWHECRTVKIREYMPRVAGLS